MRDELYDREYQLGRAELHSGGVRLLSRLRDGLSVTFAAIHRVEWSAPWSGRDKDRTGIA